jgi:hypothetical protein
MNPTRMNASTTLALELGKPALLPRSAPERRGRQLSNRVKEVLAVTLGYRAILHSLEL